MSGVPEAVVNRHGVAASAHVSDASRPVVNYRKPLVGGDVQIGSQERHGAHRSTMGRAAYGFHGLILRSRVNRRRVGDSLDVAVLQESDVEFPPQCLRP